MHVRREDMHICVSSLLKCKMHLHDSIGGHLHYATVESEVQIYICIALLEIASNHNIPHLGPKNDTSTIKVISSPYHSPRGI
jgi:hypothetical protein